jgi:parvulin-like peptidyl-prolyl isomerase
MTKWIVTLTSLLLVQVVQAQVVATIGSRTISLKEFNEKFNIVKNAPNAPTAEMFLEDLVRFEVGYLEAEKKNMQNDPQVKERIRQAMYQGYLENEIGKKVQAIKVNEAEMKKFYKSYPEIRMSHILIEFKPDANEQEKAVARKRAQEIYDEVRKSKRPFEELVKLYTDDPLSKTTGGDVGWQTRVTLMPNVYDAAMKLRVGEMTGLVPTRWGFHIIKLTGLHSYQQANKRQIRAAVFDEKRKEIFDGLFDRLKRNYKIEVNKSLIK